MKLDLFQLMMIFFTLLGITIVFAVRPGTFGLGIYYNESIDEGSMYPAALQNDAFIVLSVDPSDLKVGDIIAIDVQPTPIIHRIVQISNIEGTLYFRTSGDNSLDNNYVDVFSTTGSLLPEDKILGKVLIELSFVGPLIFGMKDVFDKYLLVTSIALAFIILAILRVDIISVSSRKVEISPVPYLRGLWHSISTKHARSAVIGLSILFIILPGMILLPIYLYGGSPTDRAEIWDISVGSQTHCNEDIVENTPYGYSYYNVIIKVVNRGLYNIDKIELTVVLANDSTLAQSLWGPVGKLFPNKISGNYSIGMSIVIPDGNAPSSSEILFVKVKMQSSFFRFMDTSFWSKSFPFNVDLLGIQSCSQSI